MHMHAELSPDIRITRNPDLPAHFGTRIPDTPNPGKRMLAEFQNFGGNIGQELCIGRLLQAIYSQHIMKCLTLREFS